MFDPDNFWNDGSTHLGKDVSAIPTNTQTPRDALRAPHRHLRARRGAGIRRNSAFKASRSRRTTSILGRQPGHLAAIVARRHSPSPPLTTNSLQRPRNVSVARREGLERSLNEPGLPVNPRAGVI